MQIPGCAGLVWGPRGSDGESRDRYELSLQQCVQLVGRQGAARSGRDVRQELDDVEREQPQREVPERLLPCHVQPRPPARHPAAWGA